MVDLFAIITSIGVRLFDITFGGCSLGIDALLAPELVFGVEHFYSINFNTFDTIVSQLG